MLVEMAKCVMCLNWFCFCLYYKGCSGYSTIGGHSMASTDIMNDRDCSQVKFDACENYSKLSLKEKNKKTTAIVSQAEIWQEDKKFTVIFLFY